MKLSIFLVTFVFWKYCESEVLAPVFPQFFEQPLDHFNKSDTRTWKQRFFVRQDFASNGKAPSILGIVDAVRVSPHDVEKGLWLEQAKHFKTNLFVTDMRFFGFNRPVSTLSDEGLSYFTIEQMVGDVANFMKKGNEYLASDDRYGNTSRTWIVQGCGFAGILATLVRAQYPDLVIGAMCLRSPLRPMMENPDYVVKVIDAYRDESPKCVENMREGFKQLTSIARSTSGTKEISSSVELCVDIRGTPALKEKDLSTLAFLIEHMLGAVSVNRQMQKVTKTVRDVCTIMNDKSMGSPYKRLMQAYEMIRINRGEHCTPLYRDLIERMHDTSYNAQLNDMIPNLRQWKYVQCFQLATFTSAKNAKDTFGEDLFNLDFLQGICRDSFPSWTREQLQSNLDKSQIMFTNVLPNLTNAVFLHEKSDPYSAAFFYTKNPKSYNIDISGPGNCKILEEAKLFDSFELTRARRQLNDIIAKWIKET